MLVCRPGKSSEPRRLQGGDPVLLLQERGHGKKPGALIAGFVPATSLAVPAHYPPPKVPPDFSAKHHFPAGSGPGESPSDGLHRQRILQFCTCPA